MVTQHRGRRIRDAVPWTLHRGRTTADAVGGPSHKVGVKRGVSSKRLTHCPFIARLQHRTTVLSDIRSPLARAAARIALSLGSAVTLGALVAPAVVQAQVGSTTDI